MKSKWGYTLLFDVIDKVQCTSKRTETFMCPGEGIFHTWMVEEAVRYVPEE
ncbi:hypothetical protein J2T19_004590 [Paenibacillus tundrae]|uniref:Uncharacterized protein n=1 Tax=Paenibacillus tundrae TaxID=528187 RepID=A0ABT9WIJ5_9BACL|nr:hypothetical protein [Paenibacillus tundrae]